LFAILRTPRLGARRTLFSGLSLPRIATNQALQIFARLHPDSAETLRKVRVHLDRDRDNLFAHVPSVTYCRARSATSYCFFVQGWLAGCTSSPDWARSNCFSAARVATVWTLWPCLLAMSV